ncbi:MAG: type I-C CRISPR-associated protein Cas8c/Csd1 [Christensenellales bacterium]
MSWIGNLYDTYCACESAVGICAEDSQAKMLLPEGHNLIEPDYIVSIREDGTFLKADKISKGKYDPKFLVAAPRTDESEGRSGISAKDFPHPLFDQVKYLSGSAYRDSLYKWIGFLRDKTEYGLAYRVLSAVYNYVISGTLKTDIPEAKDDSAICFCVNINGENENRLWRMPELWKAWIDYQQTGLVSGHRMDVCYISGDTLPYTEKHPKAINRFAGNAKLISGNDSTNFTFRGRFREASQAVIVSYNASQKAHQALRWLIATRGTYCGTQSIFAWAVDKEVDVEDPLEDSLSIYRTEIKTDADKLIEISGTTDLDYGLALRNVLCGAGNANRLKKHMRRIALLAVDAATTGRLSITYYHELPEGEYHERIAEWHEQCRWYQPFEGNKDGEGENDYFIGAPSVRRIVKAILGKKPDSGSESYDKMEKGVRERLLYCIMDGEDIPKDMLNAVLHRASNPFGLENAKNTALRWRDWEEVLSVTCGLWKRHYYEKGDEYKLALEENRTNRDYLYGRLLAVADRIESSARYKQGNAKDDRATNAIRYMTALSQHPFRTWRILWEQLNPYIQQLNGADWYLNQIGGIMANFCEGEYESNRPLDGSYLMGYFLQRQALRPKK